METLLIHPENTEQLKTIKIVLKAMKVGFESTNKSPYNKAFVEKITQSRKEISTGKRRKISLEEKKILHDNGLTAATKFFNEPTARR